MRRQRKTREKEPRSFVRFPEFGIWPNSSHRPTRCRNAPKATHPSYARVCVFPLTLSFPRYFIFSAWFASSPTQFLILSRSLRARRGKRKGKKKKDTGKNEKRERRREGKKIKRGCKRKANRKIRTNRIIRKAFAFSSTNFNSIPHRRDSLLNGSARFRVISSSIR